MLSMEFEMTVGEKSRNDSEAYIYIQAVFIGN